MLFQCKGPSHFLNMSAKQIISLSFSVVVNHFFFFKGGGGYFQLQKLGTFVCNLDFLYENFNLGPLAI